MDDATVALRVARRLKPRRRTTSACSPPTRSSDLYHQATTGIFAVLVGVVALSLVVGGIVIMNIMLMVVSERTREIGLRKALGAGARDIMSQVLTESITLSIFGGIVGIAARVRSPRMLHRRASRRCRPGSSRGRSCSASASPPASACSSASTRRRAPPALDPIEALRRE